MNAPTIEMTTALARFLDDPGRETIEQFLANSKEFILVQAKRWRNAGLPFVDRCREIMSELFLILMEDVIAGKAVKPVSLLAYLALRLRRLTRPKSGKAVPFGLDTDLPETGRCSFTPFRVELVMEIVGSVRHALVCESHPETRSVEFLFLHVRPELNWASRLLSKAASLSPDTRLETDKKRHQAFNRALRSRFEGIRCGDWRDIASWSAGERSHLAWSIIELSTTETARLDQSALEALEKWREDPEQASAEPETVAVMLPRYLKVLSEIHHAPAFAVGEPASSYGSMAPDEDVLEMLFRMASPSPSNLKHVSSLVPIASKPGEPSTADDENSAFSLALAEVLDWSGSLWSQSQIRKAGQTPRRSSSRSYPTELT